MTYLGVPFRHRGRSRRGLDCAGLILLASEDAGHTLKDIAVYGREPWRDGLRNAIRENLGPPVDRPPQVDDVLLFTLRKGAQPSHLGVAAPYQPDPSVLGLVHTYAGVGRVCHHSMDSIWLSRITEVYQWPG